MIGRHSWQWGAYSRVLDVSPAIRKELVLMPAGSANRYGEPLRNVGAQQLDPAGERRV
jgi:hypothetical protein